MSIDPTKHITVLRLSSMGDVAMTLPVLKALQEQHPTIQLTVVSRPQFKAFFQLLPNCQFLAADVDKEYKGVLGLWKFSTVLLQQEPLVLADLHDVLRSKLLRFFLKLRHKGPLKLQVIDKGRAEKQKLCRPVANKVLHQLPSTHQRYAAVFENLGFPIDLSIAAALPTLELTHNVQTILGSKTQKWIGIAPYARYIGKTYPGDLMQRVIRKLQKELPNAKILLFGGGKEQLEQLDELAEIFPNALNLAGKFSLYEELTIVSNLDLMLSMDSANMHMAAMFGIPVVSLWGATHPCLGFYGWQQNPDWAICADRQVFPTLPSSVNGSKVWADALDCMRSIEPETVSNKIIELIQGN